MHLLWFPVSEAEFLRSDAFGDRPTQKWQRINSSMQRIVARVTQLTRNPTQESVGEMKEAKIPPRSPENAPKCSTPRRESPPKFESPCSDASSSLRSLDRSTHSGSSISQISLKTSYAPAHKKRKIRQKVQTVTRSVYKVASVN